MQKRGRGHLEPSGWSLGKAPHPESSGAATMPPVVSGCAEQGLLSHHIKVTGQVKF